MIAAEVHRWLWVKELDVRQRSLAAPACKCPTLFNEPQRSDAGAGILSSNSSSLRSCSRSTPRKPAAVRAPSQETYQYPLKVTALEICRHTVPMGTSRRVKSIHNAGADRLVAGINRSGVDQPATTRIGQGNSYVGHGRLINLQAHHLSWQSPPPSTAKASSFAALSIQSNTAEAVMDRGTGRLVGIAAIVFPILHSITDGMEWLQGGFSALQLLAELSSLPTDASNNAWPLRPSAPPDWQVGLIGALLYGFAFVYFAFTTLYALTVPHSHLRATLDKPRVGVHSAWRRDGLWRSLLWLRYSSFLSVSVVDRTLVPDRDRAQFSASSRPSSRSPPNPWHGAAKRWPGGDGLGSRKSPLW